jgi:tRNA dimethylallyltransferase
MKRLIAIVGPTGIGKSRLALHLASLFRGEIIGADSRQIYRFIDIGTAKPTPNELASLHHLIDILDPDEEFSLAQYLQTTNRTIEEIYQRGNLPFLVGGTGLYIRSVLENWQVPAVPPDRNFRYNKEKKASEGSIDELYNELVIADPNAAAKIDRRNVRRVIRALEVRNKASQAFPRPGQKQPPAFVPFIIGLMTGRTELYHRVDLRVDDMIDNGLVREVERLLKMGYNLNLPSMSGIGYRQIGQYLKGEITLEAARQKIKTETHRFIRHQYAWFKLDDPGIHWFDIMNRPYAEIEKMLSEFLGSG